MKNLILKNKIIVIIILFLTIFSFSNKAQAAYSISVVSKDDKSVSLKAGGLTPGAVNLFSLQVVNDPSTPNANTTDFHDVTSITNVPDASGNLLGTISGLTPESKYIAKLNKQVVGTDQNITVVELRNVKFTTDKTLDSHVCNLYSVNKNTGTPLPIPQYWFLPLEGTYSNIWKGPYDTLDKCNADLSVYKPTTIPGNGSAGVGSTNTDTTYTPLAPLPDTTGTNLTSFDASQPNAFGNYFNMLIRLFIGICAVLAMIMIVLGGVEYMTSELSHHKEEGKERITNAIFGLLIALGAFALLNTINPQLLDISLISLGDASVAYDPSVSEYNLSQTQGIDSSTGFIKTSYYDQIKTISAQYSIPPCLLQVAIQRESRGIPYLIGHDEDVTSANIRSRKDFLASGKKFDGTTFPPGNTSDPRITQSDFKNTDHPSSYKAAPNPSASDLGLDWRFSHSVGMFGITFGPNNLNPTGAQSIYNNPSADIKAAATIMKSFYGKCNGSIEGTWRAYSSGSCTGNNAWTNSETAVRLSLYNQCLAQN